MTFFALEISMWMRSHLHCKGLTGGHVQVTLVGELLRSATGELTLQPLSQEQAGEAEFHKDDRLQSLQSSTLRSSSPHELTHEC